MSFEKQDELEILLAQLDDLKIQGDQRLYFIKESVLNGEYLINPKLIATRLLSHCFISDKVTA